MKKVVFIVNQAINPNSIKRINEFCTKGYEVEAYGFSRGFLSNNKPQNVKMKIIGEISNSASYFKRVPIIYSGIKDVLRTTKCNDCLYYLVGLEVAMVFTSLSKATYIYEEADLVHVDLPYHLLRKALEIIDKQIIKKSLLSVFRSEGFIQYHFRNESQENVHVIPNRVSPLVEGLPSRVSRNFNPESPRIGFVGFIRYRSVLNFAKVFCENFLQGEFHFWGICPSVEDEKTFAVLKNYSNCFFHGPFNSPEDLPSIYSQIDLVLSTYDVEYENVRYAEPNKIYEAIYFDTPIIVSKGTYLAEKTGHLGIGMSVDAANDSSILDLLNSLTTEKYLTYKEYIRKIDKTSVLNINNDFFERLKRLGY